MAEMEDDLLGLAVDAVVLLKAKDVVFEKYAGVAHPLVEHLPRGEKDGDAFVLGVADVSQDS